MIDLTPTALRVAALLAGIPDELLPRRTPCERLSLGDLVEHVDGLSLVFAYAAAKELGPITSQPPQPDASRLGPDWRTRIPERLAALAEAWRKPDAWHGMTQAGGVDLPGEAAGLVALNELVVHGWDIARASGQPYETDPAAVRACLDFVSATPEEEAGTDGLFGPAVPVAADAPELDRLIGLTGRNPSWTQPG